MPRVYAHPRQDQLIALIAEGLTVAEMADRCGISNGTAANVLADARKRLGVAKYAPRTDLLIAHNQRKHL